jgi:hypothetical protein
VYKRQGEGHGQHPMMQLQELGDDEAIEPLFVIDWKDELASKEHPAKTKEAAISTTGPQAFAWQIGFDASRRFKGKAWIKQRNSMHHA